MIIDINRLEFKEIDLSEIPHEMTCVYCGKKAKLAKWLQGSIPLPDGSNDSYCLMVCSAICKDKFINHPNAVLFITRGMHAVLSQKHNNLLVRGYIDILQNKS